MSNYATESTSSTETNELSEGVISPITVIYCVIGIVGFWGNSVVIFIFVSDRKFKTLTHRFILHQSIIDITSSILFLALQISLLTLTTMPSGPWGDFLCKAWFSGTLLWGCINTSIVNLTLLTLERYFGVCHPIWHHNNVTTNKAIIAMVTTWVIGHLAESPWGWPTHQSIDGECVFSWPSVSYSIFVGVELFVIEYLIPVSVMIYSYVNILRALKVSPVNQPTGINNVEVTLRDKQKLERAERLRWNVIKMLLIVVIWYIICFTPNIFGFDLWFLTFRQYLDLGGVFYNMSVAMAFCNMCVNPFIYAIKYEEFQIALKKRLPCGALNGSNDVRMLGDSAIDTNTSGI